VPEADDREDIEIRYRRLLSIVALDAQ